MPARVRPGTFFALPQSPQQLKQLLMVGGQDRYYQIVRCLRDEATRADRGFEFTQLDIEMSFVDEEDIIAVIEPLYARIIRETQGVEVAVPFPRMTYEEMVDRFGSDKADLRYDLELVVPRRPVRGLGLQRVRVGRPRTAGLIKAIRAPRRRRAQPQGARQARGGREGTRRRRASSGSSSEPTGRSARRWRSS